MLKIDSKKKRKYIHCRQENGKENLASLPNYETPKLRRIGQVSKAWSRKGKPLRVTTNNILCLCPDGKVKNFEYQSVLRKKKSSKKNKSLKSLTKDLHLSKIKMFNDFVVNFSKSINKNQVICSKKKTPGFKYKKLENSKSLEILQTETMELAGASENDSDLFLEEVNWNKRHIDKGKSDKTWRKGPSFASQGFWTK